MGGARGRCWREMVQRKIAFSSLSSFAHAQSLRRLCFSVCMNFFRKRAFAPIVSLLFSTQFYSCLDLLPGPCWNCDPSPLRQHELGWGVASIDTALRHRWSQRKESTGARREVCAAEPSDKLRHGSWFEAIFSAYATPQKWNKCSSVIDVQRTNF